MIIEVNNLKLYEHYDGFREFGDQILKTKINFLIYIAQLFPNAKFLFYNLLGEYGLIEKVEDLLKGIFQDFEIVYEEVEKNFNSSPVNNIPQILVDGKIKILETAETIGLLKVDKPDELVCNYTNCYFVIENFVSKDYENTITKVVDATPKNFIESHLVGSINDIGKRYFVLKLARGEEICF